MVVNLVYVNTVKSKRNKIPKQQYRYIICIETITRARYIMASKRKTRSKMGIKMDTMEIILLLLINIGFTQGRLKIML